MSVVAFLVPSCSLSWLLFDLSSRARATKRQRGERKSRDLASTEEMQLAVGTLNP